MKLLENLIGKLRKADEVMSSLWVKYFEWLIWMANLKKVPLSTIGRSLLGHVEVSIVRKELMSACIGLVTCLKSSAFVIHTKRLTVCSTTTRDFISH